MRIHTQLIPFPPDPNLLSNQVVVVIDILRSTSVIVYSLWEGAIEVIPVKTIEEAFQLAKAFPPNSILLGGEKDCNKIEGFDLGNSPRECTAERVRGKRLILSTTNGTKAFHLVSSGKEIMAGSFFNMGATAKRCLELDRDLLIFPSGNRGNFSLEDTVCGGMLIERIIRERKNPPILTDASLSAHILYQRFEANLAEAVRLSHHGREMIDLGMEDDLPYCVQIDIIDIVPVFQDGVIRPI